MEINDLIASDLKRYGIDDINKVSFFDKKELFGFKFSKVFRKTKYHYCEHHIIRFALYRLYLHHLTIKYGIQIPYSVEIGPGFYIGHFGNIFINASTKIGANVNVSQGVTIGYSNSNNRRGTPFIGNEVWIGANSVIVGGVVIGNDVVIAPNTFVNFDVPDHSIVISSRASVLHRENCTENYILNKV